jgi:tetratricopeptide (TPR) repeat protein
MRGAHPPWKPLGLTNLVMENPDITKTMDELPLPCLYEIYCTAINANCTFEIAMGSSEKLSFIQELEKGTCIDTLDKMLGDVDIAKSKATYDYDRERIFEVITRSELGFEKINSIILTKIREWILTTVKELLVVVGIEGNQQQLGQLENLNSLNEEQINLYSIVADVLCYQANYPEADRIYEQCYDWRRHHLTEHHPFTLKILHDLCWCYYLMGDHRGQALSSQCSELINQYLGPTHVTHLHTFKCRNVVGLYYVRNQQFQEAEATFYDCMEKRRQVLGIQHADTNFSIGNLSIVCSNLKKFPTAFQYAQESYDNRSKFR